jgi:hypothetical protein
MTAPNPELGRTTNEVLEHINQRSKLPTDPSEVTGNDIIIHMALTGALSLHLLELSHLPGAKTHIEKIMTHPGLAMTTYEHHLIFTNHSLMLAVILEELLNRHPDVAHNTIQHLMTVMSKASSMSSTYDEILRRQGIDFNEIFRPLDLEVTMAAIDTMDAAADA